jgi:hypothetical protein
MLKRLTINLTILKCYHHLHHVTNCEFGFANQKVDEYFSLDIFEMIASISEPAKELLRDNC